MCKVQKLLSLPRRCVDFFNSTLIDDEDQKNWFASYDPEEGKLGSGGGSSYLLEQAWRSSDMAETDFQFWLTAKPKIMIHGCGQSRRLPAYAPIGKVFMPLPALRWKKGQKIDQNLLDLQLPFLEEIINAASSKKCCLIASGDVLNYFEVGQIKDLPNVDVLCFGMWSDAMRSSHHGVFFAPKESPDRLEFMLQKPTSAKIQELSENYFYMIDTGIWLLSEKAISVLMKKSSWDQCKGEFKNKIPDYYDLYGDFGMALGKTPTSIDKEISTLSVSVYPLENGHFLHFGKNKDLFSSTHSLQNLVLDQRKCLKPPEKFPYIFTQNSIVEVEFYDNNNNIWIENSHISSKWRLNSEHIITGIPENNWTLTIPSGICLDIIPIDDGRFCIRPYGIEDAFRGKLSSSGTIYLNIPFKSWLQGHKLGVKDIDFKKDDLQFAEIFPILDFSEISSDFIQWFFDENKNEESPRNLWLKAEKLSAEQISKRADIFSIENQRKRFLFSILPKMSNNYRKSIFYRLDLKYLAKKYNEGEVELPENIAKDSEAMTKIHHCAFISEVKKQNNLKYEKEMEQAYSLLRSEIIKSVETSNIPSPKPDILKDQIIWARSPVRLDLAGGWSDTPPYCISFGGKVINLAVDLNGQPPIQAFIRISNRSEIILRSIDLGEECVISTYRDIEDFRNIGDAFSIPKAALELCGFSSKSGFKSLKRQLDIFGGGLDLTFLAAVPKGSGLGTSSILASCILNALSEACSLNWDKFTIIERTSALEQKLTTGGGWQDQAGGVFRGLKFLETEPGFAQNPKIRSLPDHLFTDAEYKQCFLLYYTGLTRVAKNILDKIVEGMFLNSSKHLRILGKIRSHAEVVYDLLQYGRLDEIGNAIKQSWLYNCELDQGTNPPRINKIINFIEEYCHGYKLTGAGGGGYMLIFAKSPDSALRIKKVLNENPASPSARFVDFSISDTGLQITRS